MSYHIHFVITRGAQSSDCPVITCSNCMEEIQVQNVAHGEDTKSLIMEEPSETLTNKTSAPSQSFPQRYLHHHVANPVHYHVANPVQHQCSDFICSACGKALCQHHPTIDLTPYYCACKANRRGSEVLTTRKLSSTESYRSHVNDHQEQAMKQTGLVSELGQHYSEILEKRNGLDPDDHPKHRSRLHCRNSCCPSPRECRDIRQSYDSDKSTLRSLSPEKSSDLSGSVNTYVTQVQQRDLLLKRFRDDYTITNEESSPCMIDEGVMAVAETAHAPVQAAGKVDAKGADNPVVEPFIVKSQALVGEIPNKTDDPLAYVNYLTPNSFANQGKIHRMPLQTTPGKSEDVCSNCNRNVELDQTPIVKPRKESEATDEYSVSRSSGPVELEVRKPDPESLVSVRNKTFTSSRPTMANPELPTSNNMGQETPACNYKVCYKPCHRPPVCPLCFDERRCDQSALIQKVDVGINTETQKKRGSFFRRSK